MTKVLWLSRHIMSAEQVADLKRIYCNDIVVKSADMTVSSWRDVVDAGADCDILAVVLPPAILADLTNPRNNSKPVIRAKANRVATGKTIVNPATGKEEAEYCFTFLPVACLLSSWGSFTLVAFRPDISVEGEASVT